MKKNRPARQEQTYLFSFEEGRTFKVRGWAAAVDAIFVLSAGWRNWAGQTLIDEAWREEVLATRRRDLGYKHYDKLGHFYTVEPLNEWGSW